MVFIRPPGIRRGPGRRWPGTGGVPVGGSGRSPLVRHLESFLLDLGSDFCFIGRQRRLRIGDEWYRVDLVFYHRRLRCLVLIDLKLGQRRGRADTASALDLRGRRRPSRRPALHPLGPARRTATLSRDPAHPAIPGANDHRRGPRPRLRVRGARLQLADRRGEGGHGRHKTADMIKASRRFLVSQTLRSSGDGRRISCNLPSFLGHLRNTGS